MDELELSYAKKYKKRLKTLALIAMIIIISMGVGLTGLGVFMIVISEKKLALIFLGVIMIVMGISDIPLGVYFRKRVNKNVSIMSDEEALKRYKRIYGLI